MSEQMREEFEAWVAKHHDGVKYARGLEMVLSGERYASMEVEWAYRGWQASRAALVIELPPIMHMPDEEGNGLSYARSTANAMRYACRDAIHAGGVKTK
jgi:hypothetical protein